jgi:hypothetical protein
MRFTAENQALEAAVRELLLARGIAVSSPSSPPADLLSHWRQPDLLLSQTCGYPLVTLLPEVQTVGCFHYSAPGCEGIDYRSLLVARAADNARSLADFRGRRAICNSPDSQSGYNVLLKMVAPLAREGRFFPGSISAAATGSRCSAYSRGRAILPPSTALAGRCWRVTSLPYWRACALSARRRRRQGCR